MKIKAGQLLILMDAGVLQKLSTQDLSPLGAYRLSRLTTTVIPEGQKIQQARNAMVREENSVVMDEAKSIRQIRPEYIAEFQLAMQPLLEEEIDLPITPLTLNDIAGAKITAQDIMALGTLLKIE